MVVFTKFDGQITHEFVNLKDDLEDKWERARENAEISFQTIYLPKVLDAQYPPKAYVRLEGDDYDDFFLKMGVMLFLDMDLKENNCAELTQQTADAIDDDSIHQLFISTQMNNLDLCVESALRWGSHSGCC